MEMGTAVNIKKAGAPNARLSQTIQPNSWLIAPAEFPQTGLQQTIGQSAPERYHPPWQTKPHRAACPLIALTNLETGTSNFLTY
jgi:hypothetical protein